MLRWNKAADWLKPALFAFQSPTRVSPDHIFLSLRFLRNRIVARLAVNVEMFVVQMTASVRLAVTQTRLKASSTTSAPQNSVFSPRHHIYIIIEITIGVHFIDMWKQDASWKKLEVVCLEGDCFHLTNRQNSHLRCT